MSLHWSLRKAFLSLLLFFWNSAFRWICLFFFPLPISSLLFSPICKASSDNHFAFLHFFFLGMVLITTSYTMLGTSVHSSSDTRQDLTPWIYLSLSLYNRKGFDLPEWSSGFPYFLQFKSGFGNKEFMSEPRSAPGLLCWMLRASLSSPVKNIINLILVLTIWWCPSVESSLVLLEEGVCYDQCIILAKCQCVYFCPASFWIPKPNFIFLLQVSLDLLLLHSSPLWWKWHLFKVLVLEGLVCHYRTIQLQLLWH